MDTIDRTILAWPPNLTVKKHPRARHVKLKASIRHGLELVVPKNFNQKEIPSILEENKAWIQKQLLHIQSQVKTSENSEGLPVEIAFSAVQETWRIEYIQSSGRLKMMVRPHHQELVLLGNIQNSNSCKKLLIKWMRDQAHIHLLHHIQMISDAIKLPYNNVIIRDQNSRWGSCSSEKSISLNYKLLFLSPELMRHVIIHELCHTVHLNHSDRFWKLVEKFDVNWKVNKRALRGACGLIPGWLNG